MVPAGRVVKRACRAMISRSRIAPTMLSALLLGLAAPASAVDAAVVLSGPAPVRIWKSQAAMEKGKDLLAASASPDPAVLAPFLACEVAPGTRATVVRSARSYVWEAEVIEGPLRGCQGIVGPRDFKTEGELAPRPRVEARPAPPPPGATGPSDRGMILWYQLYALADDGRTRTEWEPVASWETASECDNARRRLTQADEQEIDDILRRFESAPHASRGRFTMTRTPSTEGLDIEFGILTREGPRTAHVQMRTYCFPAGHDPRR